MRLKEYLDETGIPVAKLAYRCGLPFHKVYVILRGSSPTLKTAVAIYLYTKGQVMPEDLMPEDILNDLKQEIEKNRG